MEKIFQRFNHFLRGPEIVIFHEFHKPPYGGGNQFLLALEKELKQRGRDMGRNRVGKNTKICLFNSFNFDFDQLVSLHKKYKPKMIHRVDGPISVYRGTDEKIDKNILEMNHKLADATIFQSQYSKDSHEKMGLEFKKPVVIQNAVDPTIFNRAGKAENLDNTKKIKLISTSWSANQNKGRDIYDWLDKNLDFSKYEFTFLGNYPGHFKNIIHLKPLPSVEVAKILKMHDIYITASKNDPCSNALIEALACGLPAVYLNSGGHPEIVKNGGESFTGEDDILEAIEKVVSNYKYYQDKISVTSLEKIADKYLEIFNEKTYS